MGVPQYNGNQDLKTVRRYFSGTTKLRNGQVLCYQEDATKTNSDPKLQLGNVVEAINTDNVNFFAGIVPDTEAGKTGPCFVELLMPQSGDVVDVEVNGATDVAAGDLLEIDSTKGCLIKATAAAGDNLYRSFEAETSDAKVVHRAQKV